MALSYALISPYVLSTFPPMPAVSVLMVTHCDTPFLRPALASVFAQTWTDLELVLVDNGAGLSEESLGELGRDPRLHWLRRPRNFGIPGGHNAGVAACRGEFIALLDHDDVMLPLRLERQVALLRERAELGLVSCQAETIDADGRVTGREFALSDSTSQHFYTQFAAPVVTPAYTGRREWFEKLPYRAELPWTADFDFLARAAEQTRFGHVPEILLRYRRHASQATQQHAAVIELERAWIRLFTARRRAEKPEEFVALAEREIPTPVQSCLSMGRRCLAEGFVLLAGFHARRAVKLSRSPLDAWQAGQLGLKAIAAAGPDERRLVRGMFFAGPVRALALE